MWHNDPRAESEQDKGGNADAWSWDMYNISDNHNRRVFSNIYFKTGDRYVN